MGLIERVLAWEALDSRGTPTVACAVWLEGGASGSGDRAIGSLDRQRTRRASAGTGASASAGKASATPSRTVRRRDRALRCGGTAQPARGRPGAAGTRRDAVARALGSNAVLAVSVATALAAADALGCRSGAPLRLTASRCCRSRW